MLILLSPAKTLDYDTAPATNVSTKPVFQTQANALIEVLQKLAPQDISKLMKISDKLGQLNYARYQSWENKPLKKSAVQKQAMLAFKGDVYTGLDADNFSEKQFETAQHSIRILSGLYGLLKPLDLIQPYRLEMGTKLNNKSGKDLYAYWGDTIANQLNKELDTAKQKTIVNLASNEYFKSVNTKVLDAEIITPVFKDLKNGQYKIISFYAKKARGMMAAHLVKKSAKTPKAIQSFNTAGYAFNADLSKDNEWVFTRDHAE